MAKYTPSQQVEIFHLTFLRFLERAVSKSDYAVKGGCNLRFFFNSIRYSEDIDLNVWSIPQEKLEEKVTSVLQSKNLQDALYAKGIEVVNPRPVKQTNTTQRWKMSLQTTGAQFPSPTRIEFSRRDKKTEEKTLLEAVSPELLNNYELPPILAVHYVLDAAFEQKLDAILSRAEPQARDVFDLNHLLTRGANPQVATEYITRNLSALSERILAIDTEVFSSQVVNYLPPEHQRYYEDESNWESLQLKVIAALEEVA